MGAVSPELESKARKAIELMLDRSMFLKYACAEVGITPAQFVRVRSAVSGIDLDYRNARAILATFEADEAKEIADDDDRDPQRQRNQIEVRKWRAAKFAPTEYGERIEITGSVTSINIMSTIEDARARLRPMSDLAHVQDAELVELPTLDTSAPSDTQSDSVPGLLT